MKLGGGQFARALYRFAATTASAAVAMLLLMFFPFQENEVERRIITNVDCRRLPRTGKLRNYRRRDDFD